MWKQRRSSDGRGGRWGAGEWLLRALRYAREESDTSGGSSLVSSHLRVLLVPLKEFPSPGSNLQRGLSSRNFVVVVMITLGDCRRWKNMPPSAKVSNSVANDSLASYSPQELVETKTEGQVKPISN